MFVHLVGLAFPLTGALRVHPQVQVDVIRTDAGMIRSGGSGRSRGPETHEEQRAERRSRAAGEPHECDVQTVQIQHESVCPAGGFTNGTNNCTNVVKR